MTSDVPSLPRDFVEFLELLHKHQVRFLVVGAWAVALHGRPRYTKDIDLLVARDPVNARRIIIALDEFGFGSIGLTEEDFLKEQFVIQLGYEPNRIDLLTGIESLNFDDLERNKEIRMVGNIALPILSYQDLIKAKRVASRPQDLADIDQLERIKKAGKR